MTKDELEAIKDHALDQFQVKSGQREHYKKVIDFVIFMIEKGVTPDQVTVRYGGHELRDEKQNRQVIDLTKGLSPFSQLEDHKRHMMLKGKY